MGETNFSSAEILRQLGADAQKKNEAEVRALNERLAYEKTLNSAEGVADADLTPEQKRAVARKLVEDNASAGGLTAQLEEELRRRGLFEQ